MMLHRECLPRWEPYVSRCRGWQRAEVPSSNSMSVQCN
jgi:hypothetical protein